MPTYVYRREDGTTFEIDQRITEDALETCPETGQPVERVISGGTGLIFKGSGFYLTDYARNNGNGSSTNETGATKDAKTDAPATSSSSDDSSATPAKKEKKEAA